MEVLGTTVAATKDYDGLWGLISILLVLLTAVGATAFSYFQLQRAGRQKIAEARLTWADQYRQLAVQLDQTMMEIERLMVPGKLPNSFRRRRLQLEARRTAIEMFLMVNPESFDNAAEAERLMEVDLCTRLARLGVAIDMHYVRQHRKVLKFNWHRVKKEF
ncbi:hypothetical protein GOC54_05345 [Sinorhizobium meliloti]|uniref:hypothetical protein n=1 Tax=Rhizobium meliloti TaxID=382 RepID=UPI0003DBDF8D|nr:hypothetical protein [Sinorhizobium meliloti]ARS70881.1 hypothetical protein SMRU11_28285 [Sinorhizobium meliloti RU11/001]MDX0310549.1 hypothetical protein [Sinorhizobium meliloti]RVM38514.1 hypothetical protein CN129_07610 [Sinorhizobium meliloti]RVO34822.1 hypothetical protein CN095_17020 [Sinorhizobium meliloti]